MIALKEYSVHQIKRVTKITGTFEIRIGFRDFKKNIENFLNLEDESKRISEAEKNIQKIEKAIREDDLFNSSSTIELNLSSISGRRVMKNNFKKIFSKSNEKMMMLESNNHSKTPFK